MSGVPAAPTFPKARHIVQVAELDAIRSGGGSHRELYESHVRPLVTSGQLEPVDGPIVVAAGVRLRPAPGHTAGHQVVLVNAPNGTLTISGDAFVHPVQAADPGITYRYEVDAVGAALTRRQLLQAGGLIAPAHWAATLCRIGHDEGGLSQLVDVFGCPREPPTSS